MHSDPHQADITVPMPYKSSVQITEIMPLAVVFLINYTHSLPQRKRRREGEQQKGLGGLSNADHLSLPAPSSKPPTPNSWVVAMETTSAPQ